VLAVTLPERNLGPPQEAEGAPIRKTGTPADQLNANLDLIKQLGNATLGGLSPLDWALSWAAADYLVIPLEHGKNRPHRLLGSGWSAKAGTAGSRSPEQIKAWWECDPSAMIGIVTAVSPFSGVLIIDIDTKPGKPNGWVSISDLVKEYGPLPETMRVITPSGGMHLYYAMPEGEPRVRFRVGWLPGVDIPWLVPVPPSAKLIRHEAQPDTAEDYVHYQLARIVEPPLPIAPAWVFPDIRTTPAHDNDLSAKKGVRRVTPTERSQPQRPIGTGRMGWHSEALPPTALFVENGLGWFTGSRDSDCFRLACRLWSQYGDEATVVSLIFKTWEHTPPKDHPFSWQDAYHKIKQAERYWLEDREHILRRAESLMRDFR
jgi:hypothetical protein